MKIDCFTYRDESSTTLEIEVCDEGFWLSSGGQFAIDSQESLDFLLSELKEKGGTFLKRAEENEDE